MTLVNILFLLTRIVCEGIINLTVSYIKQKMLTYVLRNPGGKNIRENRRDNQGKTIQKHWQ